MVAICSVGVASFRLQVPHHQDCHDDQYCKFLCDTLDQLEHGYRGCFVIVNGLSLDKNSFVHQYATMKGFKYLRIPRVDCELDPCKQFWKVMLSNVDRKAGDSTTTVRFNNALSLIDPHCLEDMITKCESNFRQYFTTTLRNSKTN
ncbi:hypothetical protein BC940DRAFT_306848 [Gongronella butleri]|nr:hypothetical protein BC940DRAFT_306848 [Gongronella butleri]